jgi:hypothetical protein
MLNPNFYTKKIFDETILRNVSLAITNSCRDHSTFFFLKLIFF